MGKPSAAGGSGAGCNHALAVKVNDALQAVLGAIGAADGLEFITML